MSQEFIIRIGADCVRHIVSFLPGDLDSTHFITSSKLINTQYRSKFPLKGIYKSESILFHPLYKHRHLIRHVEASGHHLGWVKNIPLQTLTFDSRFNQSLDAIVLPTSLQELTFGYHFDQSVDKLVLPNSLQQITFGENFNQSIDNLVLPDSLTHLTFSLENEFNHPVDKLVLPASLQQLTFGGEFNQSVDKLVLPASLQQLTFGFDFNQSVDKLVLPASLHNLPLVVSSISLLIN